MMKCIIPWPKRIRGKNANPIFLSISHAICNGIKDQTSLGMAYDQLQPKSSAMLFGYRSQFSFRHYDLKLHTHTHTHTHTYIYIYIYTFNAIAIFMLSTATVNNLYFQKCILSIMFVVIFITRYVIR